MKEAAAEAVTAKRKGRGITTGIITAPRQSQTITADIDTRILKRSQRRILRETRRTRKEIRRSPRETSTTDVAALAAQNLIAIRPKK